MKNSAMPKKEGKMRIRAFPVSFPTKIIPIAMLGYIFLFHSNIILLFIFNTVLNGRTSYFHTLFTFED